MKSIQITITGFNIAQTGLIEDIVDTIARAGGRATVEWGSAGLQPVVRSAMQTRAINDAIVEVKVNPAPAGVATPTAPLSAEEALANVIKNVAPPTSTSPILPTTLDAARSNNVTLLQEDGITEIVAQDLTKNGITWASTPSISIEPIAVLESAKMLGDATARLELMFRHSGNVSIDGLPDIAYLLTQADYHVSALMLMHGLPRVKLLEGCIAAEETGVEFDASSVLTATISEPPKTQAELEAENAHLRGLLAQYRK